MSSRQQEEEFVNGVEKMVAGTMKAAEEQFEKKDEVEFDVQDDRPARPPKDNNNDRGAPPPPGSSMAVA